MDSFDATLIPENQIAAVCAFISKNNAEHIKPIMVQKTLQDNVFALLKRVEPDCVVLYYPNDDTHNNGFHVEYPVGHVIYINTKQHYEKQIFTAAHELGHMWGLDKWMRETVKDYPNDPCWDERVISRFAAELLMPNKEFTRSANELILDARNNGSAQVSLSAMIFVVTTLMNEFFTPFKSVVRRLFELGFITESAGRTLWGENENLPWEQIVAYSMRIAEEHDYAKLYKISEKKWIDGVDELFRKAKTLQALPEKWLECFNERFGGNLDKQDMGLTDALLDISNKEGEIDAANSVY